MRYVLTAEQMRLAEERAVADAGITLAELMERAGGSVAAEILSRYPDDARVVVLAGPGNNGGDGWVAARALHEAHADVEVLSTRPLEELSGIAADAAHRAIDEGVRWQVSGVAPEPDSLEGAVVVDALLGTGATGELRDPLPAWVDAVRLAQEDGSIEAVIAVDVPTGVDTDTAAAADAIDADVTITFASPKRGLVLYPGASKVGELVVVDIGIPYDLAEFAGSPEVWSAAEYAPLVPVAPDEATKMERGMLLIVAGSVSFAGAAVLTAWGAQRAGAGYVRLAVPEPIRAITQTAAPSVVTVGLDVDVDGTFSTAAVAQLQGLIDAADAVVCGPGMSRGSGPTAIAEAVVASDKPLVLDADGLNAFADRGAHVSSRKAPTVLTPHRGELARMLSATPSEIEADRVSSVGKLACDDVTVVLKGASSLVCGGGRTVVNLSGTSALATAGTGDVLAGTIGAFMAQGVAEPFEAACLGTFVHGRAGELAECDFSPISVTAEDLPARVAHAIAELLA